MSKIRFATLRDALMGAVVVVVRDGTIELYEGVDIDESPSDFLIVQDNSVIGHSRMMDASDVSELVRGALCRHLQIEENGEECEAEGVG